MQKLSKVKKHENNYMSVKPNFNDFDSNNVDFGSVFPNFRREDMIKHLNLFKYFSEFSNVDEKQVLF